jgi:hypothetical protein
MGDRQTEHKGIVVYMHDHGNKPWGKIEPANGSPEVWFGVYAANGTVFEKGDIVTFLYNREFRDGKPSAFRVYMKEKAVTDNYFVEQDDSITSLRGEFET